MYPHLQVSLLLLGTLMCLPSLAPAQRPSPRVRGTVATGATLTPPSPAPQGLSQTGALATVISLRWDTLPGATGYHILRSTTANGPWLDRTPTPAPFPGGFVADKDLLPSYSMWYRVSALYSDGSSGVSGAVQMATSAAPPLQNVMATWVRPDLGRYECYGRLSWTSDTLASGYYVFRDKVMVTRSPVPASGNTSTVTYLDPQSLSNGAYEYFVVQLYEAKDFPAQGQTSLAEGDLQQAKRIRLEVPADGCIIP